MAKYFLAATASQETEFMDNHCIRSEWFGADKNGMVPLKIDSAQAIRAHVLALGAKPAAVISVTLSLSYFHDLVESGTMVPCLHVGGYRLYTDLLFDGERVVSAEIIQVL